MPHVVSHQLKTIDSSKDWIEFTTDQVEEYQRVAGLFLKPGQVIKFGQYYDVSTPGMWYISSGDENEAWTV